MNDDGVISEMVSIKHVDGELVVTPLFTVETAREMGLAIKGEKVRYLAKHGYDNERQRANTKFVVNDELTVKTVRIDSWNSSYEFEEVEGQWNTVMFEAIYE